MFNKKKRLYEEISRLNEKCKELSQQVFRVGDKIMTIQIKFGRLESSALMNFTVDQIIKFPPEKINALTVENIVGVIKEVLPEGYIVELSPFGKPEEITLYYHQMKLLKHE